MFVSRSMIGLSAVVLGAGVCAGAAQAETIANASLDADVYLAFGINSDSSELTIGNEINSPHFNVGFIEFGDLSAFSSEGSKYLKLDLEVFRTGGGPSGPVVDMTTGNATLKIVALDSSYAEFAASGDMLAWYDTNVGGKDAAGTVALTSAGEFYVDVTDVVNGWLAVPSSNKGFALVVTSGPAIELGANNGGNGAVLTSVPEPGSLALIGLGGLALLRRRR